MNDNKRSNEILKLMIEFQIIENYRADFLIGRDIMKDYKMNIWENNNSIIIIRSIGGMIRLFIIDDIYYEIIKFDPWIYIIQVEMIKSGEEKWIIIKFIV